MARAWCVRHSDSLHIMVQVQPNAKKTEVSGELEGALKIRLKAQPMDGKANDELIRFIAEQLGVPRKQVSIAHGQTSRQKTLHVHSDLAVDDAQAVLLRQPLRAAS